jgi:hypothetical protein
MFRFSFRALPVKSLLVGGVVCCINPAFAQNTPTLEFFSGANNPTASGPTIASQTITFQNNTDNPSASTFAAYSPTTTATFALSNQMYGPSDAARGIMFGGQSNSGNPSPGSLPIFAPVSSLGGSINGNYTSGPTAGSGINVATNYAVELFTDTQYLTAATPAGRYQYADLTIIFNKAVINPVLHLTGLGTPGNGSLVGATTEFDVLTSGVTLSPLSGSTGFSVTGNSINNTNTSPTATTNNGSTSTGAASGSVGIATAAGGITSLQLRVYLRKAAGTGAISPASVSYGDGWLIGVSSLTPATPLPVTLVDFSARATAGGTSLRWTTASELRNAYFEVQRSFDGQVFSPLGQVTGQGSKVAATTYQYTDASREGQAAARVYYRLRQVDADGTATYSPVRTVAFAATAAAITLAPNPATGNADLDLTQLPAGPYQVTVLDALGRSLLSQELVAGEAHTLPLTQLPSGQYIVQVRSAKFSQTKRLSKL